MKYVINKWHTGLTILFVNYLQISSPDTLTGDFDIFSLKYVNTWLFQTMWSLLIL